MVFRWTKPWTWFSRAEVPSGPVVQQPQGNQGALVPVVSGALVPVVSSRSTTYQNAGVGRREAVRPDGHPQVPGPGSVALVVAGGNSARASVGGLAAGRSRAQGPTGGAPAGRTGPRQGQVTTFTVKQWVEMVRDGAQHVKACCKEKNGVTFRTVGHWDLGADSE